MHLRRDPAFGMQRCSVEAVPRSVEPQAQRYIEAGGGALVAGLAARGRVGFHRGDVRVIQTAAEDPSLRAARVRFQRHCPSGGKR